MIGVSAIFWVTFAKRFHEAIQQTYRNGLHRGYISLRYQPLLAVWEGRWRTVGARPSLPQRDKLKADWPPIFQDKLSFAACILDA